MSDASVGVDTSSVRVTTRGWLGPLLALSAVAVVAVLVWIVWFSSVLSAREIRVVGAEGGAAERVVRTAAISQGEPLARMNADAAAARVLEIPWVADAEVRRGWPSEVVIAVSQRTPVAKIIGTGQVVDVEGAVFDLPGRLPDGLPTVRADGEALVEAMSVLRELPDDLQRRVRVISATTRDDVSFVLGNGTTIRWGSAERGDLKAQVVTALLPRRARMIDVTAPELPTTFAERPPKKTKADD